MSHLGKRPALIVGSNYFDDMLTEYDLKDVWLPWIRSCDYILAESPKSVNRLFKRIKLSEHKPFELMRDYRKRDISQKVLDILINKESVVILTDVGQACVADPGSYWVDQAHQVGCPVFTIPAHNSIMYALALSGFNGQQFSFHGYIPREQGQRLKKLETLYRICRTSGATQVFIEAPFRNKYCFEDIQKSIPKDIKCRVVSQIMSENQSIKRLEDMSSIESVPSIFLLGR